MVAFCLRGVKKRHYVLPSIKKGFTYASENRGQKKLLITYAKCIQTKFLYLNRSGNKNLNLSIFTKSNFFTDVSARRQQEVC